MFWTLRNSHENSFGNSFKFFHSFLWWLFQQFLQEFLCQVFGKSFGYSLGNFQDILLEIPSETPSTHSLRIRSKLSWWILRFFMSFFYLFDNFFILSAIYFGIVGIWSSFHCFYRNSFSNFFENFFSYFDGHSSGNFFRILSRSFTGIFSSFL